MKTLEKFAAFYRRMFLKIVRMSIKLPWFWAMVAVAVLLILYVNRPISGEAGDLTWTLYRHVLTISGEGDMDGVSWHKDLFPKKYHEYEKEINSVVIQDGVTSIGDFAFGNRDDLTDVVIPASVTSIGEYAFGNCANLTSVTIPDSVTSIGDSAFYNCGALTGDIILNSVVNIGEQAFENCNGLTGVQFLKGVSRIGKGAFENCDGLTSVTISDCDSLSSIESNAFSGCPNLTDVTLPYGLSHIESGAFRGCAKLTSVYIPDSVSTVGKSAFAYCNTLTSVSVQRWTQLDENAIPEWTAVKFRQNSLTWTLQDGVLTISGRGPMENYKRLDEYGSNAPWYQKNVLSIVIEDGVASIGDYAFAFCPCRSIEIPDSVSRIGKDAFYNCQLLESVRIPYRVTAMPSFSNCVFLRRISAPEHCSGVLVPIGADDTYYGPVDWTFTDGVEDVLTVSGHGDMEDYLFGVGHNRQYFAEKKQLQVDCVVIEDGVRSIGAGAFAKCVGLKSVTIPDSVTRIGKEAFRDCDRLTSVVIPDGVTNIGKAAFIGCASLTSVEIPDSVTYIGSSAFSDCDSLTGVEIPDSVTYLGKYAFYDCDSLTNVVIPGGVTSIKEGAFSDCDSLTSVVIPDSVTSIGKEAFAHCENLKSVSVPKKAKLLKDAFPEWTTVTRREA